MDEDTTLVKVLVTGASGFIGGAIVDAMAKSNRYHVTATGRSVVTKWDNAPNVQYISMDLSKVLQVLRFEICVHCAGLADDKSTEEDLYNANVLATENLLSALEGCHTFVNISSGSVYQFGSPNPLKEDEAPLAAPSLYGRSKREAEKRVESSDIERRISLRPRAVYGPGDRTLWPRFLGRIRNGNLVMPGPLSPAVSMTHVHNLVEGVILSVEKAKPGYAVYNIADAQVYSLRDVFENILRIVFQGNGRHKVITIPQQILRGVVRVAKVIRVPISLSHQAIDYVTQPAVIDISAIQNDLGYSGEVKKENRPDVGDFMS